MKKTTMLGCVILAIAGVVCFVIKYFKNERIDSFKDKNNQSSEIIISEGQKENLDEQLDLSDRKAEAEESIRQRHEEAQRAMSESVTSIMSEELPKHTKNDELKKRLFDDIEEIG